MKVIGLPNGRKVSLGSYIRGWKAVKAAKPSQAIKGWEHFPVRADEVLRDYSRGVQARINRHDPAYGIGRKWDPDWERAMIQASRQLNTPRLIIRYLPSELKERFAHRLERNKQWKLNY
jgi:hypothetical protein